ncbi:MAG: bifunctional 4-hydroxy-3-methylbut-2-enyl diphosphate reductase/30S ribosomal protein S1, partial [Firmicutes bacterium]|nr:bifunctional 4-hydroxy-3-methylbut-2-enyl diphosphate reductase/30S ribosomal protein S1 [Bacillota bacterium]
MQIRVAEHSGFCFGVKRAVQLAVNSAAEGKVYSLGPLIHNPREIVRLADKVGVINDLDEAVADKLLSKKSPRVIIRSHGAGPQVYARAKELEIELIDATCPFVARVQ